MLKSMPTKLTHFYTSPKHSHNPFFILKIILKETICIKNHHTPTICMKNHYTNNSHKKPLYKQFI